MYRLRIKRMENRYCLPKHISLAGNRSKILLARKSLLCYVLLLCHLRDMAIALFSISSSSSPGMPATISESSESTKTIAWLELVIFLTCFWQVLSCVRTAHLWWSRALPSPPPGGTGQWPSSASPPHPNPPDSRPNLNSNWYLTFIVLRQTRIKIKH